MRNPGKGRLLTFEPSSGNWRKNLGTDIRNGSVKRYPIIGIPFGLRPHSIPIMGNDTVNGILPKMYHLIYASVLKTSSYLSKSSSISCSKFDFYFILFNLSIIVFETCFFASKNYCRTIAYIFHVFVLIMVFIHYIDMVIKKQIGWI